MNNTLASEIIKDLNRKNRCKNATIALLVGVTFVLLVAGRKRK